MLEIIEFLLSLTFEQVWYLGFALFALYELSKIPAAKRRAAEARRQERLAEIAEKREEERIQRYYHIIDAIHEAAERNR